MFHTCHRMHTRTQLISFVFLFGYFCSVYNHPTDDKKGIIGVPIVFKKKSARLRQSHASSQHTQVTSIENLKDKHNAAISNGKQKEKHNDGVSNNKKTKRSRKGHQKYNKVQAFAQNGTPDKARFMASTATLIKRRKGHKRKGTLGTQARALPPFVNFTWPPHLAYGYVRPVCVCIDIFCLFVYL